MNSVSAALKPVKHHMIAIKFAEFHATSLNLAAGDWFPESNFQV